MQSHIQTVHSDVRDLPSNSEKIRDQILSNMDDFDPEMIGFLKDVVNASEAKSQAANPSDVSNDSARKRAFQSATNTPLVSQIPSNQLSQLAKDLETSEEELLSFDTGSSQQTPGMSDSEPPAKKIRGYVYRPEPGDSSHDIQDSRVIMPSY